MRLYSAKETYKFKEPTNRSHPIQAIQHPKKRLVIFCFVPIVFDYRGLKQRSFKMEGRLYSLRHTATHCNALQHTATHCSTLHHTASHCNTLHHIALHCNTLQHTTTHCNILQDIATHSHTLQHTATHSNTVINSEFVYTEMVHTKID